MNAEGHIPQVSVILPVYNAEAYVADAIRSILTQTFKDFELIIINDGSTDNSVQQINLFNDNRIVYIEQKNIGLAASLNKGLSIAKAELIARQDNDDISYPERLEKQMLHMKAHSNIALLGTWARVINAEGISTQRFHKHPANNITLQYFLLFDNPFVHSSVMFRKSAFNEAGGYSASNNLFEDYDLWSRMAQFGSVGNVPEILLDYRELQTGMSKSATDYAEKVARTSFNNLLKLGIAISDEKLHQLNKAVLSKTESLRIIDLITEAFCIHNNVSLESVAEIKTQRINLYLRQHYAYIIEADHVSLFQKMRAKILRYFLFRKAGWK